MRVGPWLLAMRDVERWHVGTSTGSRACRSSDLRMIDPPRPSDLGRTPRPRSGHRRPPTLVTDGRQILPRWVVLQKRRVTVCTMGAHGGAIRPGRRTHGSRVSLSAPDWRGCSRDNLTPLHRHMGVASSPSSSSASPAPSPMESPRCSSTTRRPKRPPITSSGWASSRNLARQPLWLAGNGLDGVGYVLQFMALRRGSLVLVEPLLVLSLVVALPVAARREHQRISLAALASAGAIAAGLGLFLGVARPGIDHPHATAEAWIILSAVVAAVCAARCHSPQQDHVAESSRRPPGRRVRCRVRLCRSPHRSDGSSAQHGGAPSPDELAALCAARCRRGRLDSDAGSIPRGRTTPFAPDPHGGATARRHCHRPLLWRAHQHGKAWPRSSKILGLAVVVAGVFALAQTPAIAGLEDASPATAPLVPRGPATHRDLGGRMSGRLMARSVRPRGSITMSM